MSIRQQFSRVHVPKQLNEPRYDTGPTGLMAGAETRTIVAMKVFVEQNIVLPVRIALKFAGTAEHRALPFFISEEDAREATGNVSSDFKQRHEIT